ncbi:hypothetical protein ES703_56286 [subsurface metagenome]
MTKAGFGFIVAGVAIYLVASQTQVGWLYLFDAIIWSLLVLSAILPRYSLKSLQVEQQVLLPASLLRQLPLSGPLEDETIEIKLKVSNNGRLARHFIKLLADCPFEQPEERRKDFLLTTLNPRSTTVFSYTGTCYRRGHYTSSNATLQSSGPLGLVVRRRIFQLPLNLIIYPNYYQMERLHTVGEAWVDWGHGVKSSAATEFYGSREYQYGDPLKRIHWRNTAKVGYFMLKEFEQAGQGSVSVAFETSRDFGTGRETTLEYSIKIAASLAKICADSGRNIDIIAGETPLHNAEWQVAMDYLAHLEVAGKDVSAELTAALKRSRAMVAIVPAAETGLASALSQLADRGQRLLVILLEGFTQDEVPHKAGFVLKAKNMEIINCSQGNLEATINKLSSSLFFSGKSPVRVN